jgi:hypothetical protein
MAAPLAPRRLSSGLSQFWNGFVAWASGAETNPNHLDCMKTDNLSYHEARAEEELALAQTAATANAVRAHVTLAEMHLEFVYEARLPVPDTKPAA